MVRLDSKTVLKRFQHELSGGMKQRVVSALALLLDPKLVILDEPTSALDMLTQKFFVKILAEIKKKKNITMIFITHDIATVAEIADRVAVMYAGKVIEVGPVDEIFYNPLHPYTKALLNSIPSVIGDVSRFKPIPGTPPDPVQEQAHPSRLVLCPQLFQPPGTRGPEPSSREGKGTPAGYGNPHRNPEEGDPPGL